MIYVALKVTSSLLSISIIILCLLYFNSYFEDKSIILQNISMIKCILNNQINRFIWVLFNLQLATFYTEI